ncbi:MAG: type II toxin-antitoxin system RelE/ParE family toxin [Psychrosphaera sp.]|nr:type II toxin-antitoxin system RelE/ParE family toxin [Psychrosphaera sp.]
MHNQWMKEIRFVGQTLNSIKRFPQAAKQDAGFQLSEVQQGNDPEDWKPMTSIGAGVREIRIKESTGIYRVIYVAKFKNAIYVLHAFKKKSQKTSKQDIDTAKKAYKEIMEEQQ